MKLLDWIRFLRWRLLTLKKQLAGEVTNLYNKITIFEMSVFFRRKSIILIIMMFIIIMCFKGMIDEYLLATGLSLFSEKWKKIK